MLEPAQTAPNAHYVNLAPLRTPGGGDRSEFSGSLVVKQALAAYEKTVLTSFEDVENALVAYHNEQVRHGSLNDSVAANRRALALASERYTKGLENFLSLIEAERSLYQAEDQLVVSQRLLTQNLVALYKALGGGWETDGASVPESPQ